jgi:hypothetical protein
MREIWLATAAVSSLVLTGCSLLGEAGTMGQSEAYRLGYEQASQLEFDPVDNIAGAFAFCSVIADNFFRANSQEELDDYIAGCTDFVLNR